MFDLRRLDREMAEKDVCGSDADARPLPETKHSRRYLSIHEAARFLGVTEAALQTKIKRRKVPFLKVGRRVMFDLKVLTAARVGGRTVLSDGNATDLQE